MFNARKTTNLILQKMDDGELDERTVAEMCLNWLSEADVHEMALSNDIIVEDEDEDEDED